MDSLKRPGKGVLGLSIACVRSMRLLTCLWRIYHLRGFVEGLLLMPTEASSLLQRFAQLARSARSVANGIVGAHHPVMVQASNLKMRGLDCSRFNL